MRRVAERPADWPAMGAKLRRCPSGAGKACALERKAVAAKTEESGVTIARGFDPGEELMGGVSAAVFATGGAVLMLRQRDACAGGLAHIKPRAVTAKDFDRRPFRQHRDCRWRVRRELLRGVNNLPINHREHGFDGFDFFLRHGEVIVG